MSRKGNTGNSSREESDIEVTQTVSKLGTLYTENSALYICCLSRVEVFELNSSYRRFAAPEEALELPSLGAV